MDVIKTFGRRTASCSFSSFVTDTPAPKGRGHGVETALYSAAFVGIGWALGGIVPVPVVGRALGALLGAGVAGVKAHADYTAWKNDGGTSGEPGACVGK